MRIGQKLKNARMNAKLTQEDLSKKIGISRQTISSWENERSFPDIMSLIMLSDIYDISLDNLLKGDEEMIKNLKESTDVVKSNKQLTNSMFLWLIFYGLAYLLINIFEIPKFDNLFMNSIILFGAACAIIVQLFKHINLQKFLSEKTSNKKLVKIAVSILYIFLILIIPDILNRGIELEWQQATVRAITALALLIPITFIFKKL